MKTLFATISLVLLVAPGTAQDHSAPPDPRDIAAGHEIPDQGYCDQPYVVITKDGHWLCVLTTGTGGEGQGGQHVVATVSKDRGKTWGALIDIEPSNGPEASWVVPLVAPSGRVYAFYTFNGDQIRTLPGSGKIRADMLGWYCYRYSDDNGLTWSKRHRIPVRNTACDLANQWQGEVQIFWGIDKPKTSGSGVRFAFTKLGKYMLDNGEGWMLHSDNILTEPDPDKINWELLPNGEHGLRLPEFGSVQEEHNHVETGDNQLYLVYRTTLGHPIECYSHDGGRSWTKPDFMTYSPGGPKIKTTRACPKLFRCTNGKYLFWFHNESGRDFGGRNPAWISGGVVRDGRMHWSEPEIALYHNDPKDRGMSYPDLIEQDGRFWITETQKTTARVHEIDPTLLEGLWAQLEGKGQVTRKGLVLSIDNPVTKPEEATMPRLPDLMKPGGGFTIELRMQSSDLKAGQIILDSRDETGRGVALEVAAEDAVRLRLSDGTNKAGEWTSDPGLLTAGRIHHITAIVDGGPNIITFLVDGKLCDGGPSRQFGWGRFDAKLGDVNGAATLKLAPSLSGKIHNLRIYDRYLRTSEAVMNYQADAEAAARRAPGIPGSRTSCRDSSNSTTKSASASTLLGFPLAVIAAEDVRMIESVGPASDLTPGWTSPEAWFRHGNPAPGWPEVRPEARPGSYWWWPASAVTKEDLTWNLQTYQKAGWGNMGLIGIYGVKGEEQRTIPIFTPEWFGMYNHSVTEARRLGMNIDLTPSSGWRLGGAHVTKEHSERSFAVKNGKIEVKQLQERVKRAGPGGEGLSINPYSPAAVKFHFDWMADRFREGKGLAPRAFYYDSFENSGNWAPELPDRFKQWRGYDINDHAPALGGKGDPEEVRRVMCDYRETLSKLLLECMETIALWSVERGSGLRIQAHGAPANLLDMYAAASIPETEVFGANKFEIPGYRRDPRWSLDQPHSELVNRFASSAAHVAGRNLVISESFTWLRNHFHTALSHIKPEADRLLLCGINGIYYHGTCFSPQKTEWPGWLFYAATQMNARNSIFRDIPALNAYLARCQSVLQQGRPHNDILLYWPVSDLWMSGGNREKRFTVHQSGWIENTACGEAGRWLMKQGYTFDFISDSQLAATRPEPGLQSARLVTQGDSSYQTLLVPAVAFMHVETARRMIELATAGATVVIWRNLPQSVPGWHNYADREQELKEVLGRLAFADGVASVGQGRILLGDDLAVLMAQAGVAREAMADHGLKFIRRKLPGEVVYFIANQSAKPVDHWVPLAAPCRSAVMMDPMTGALGKARTRSEGAGTEVYLQLQPGETRIVRALLDKDSDEPSWPIVRQTGEPLAVSGPWNIRFVEGGPVLPAPARIETLASWTSLADPEAQRFAGAASYSTSVKLPGNSPDHWILDLGDVRESARVRVNGKPAGVLVAHPFRLDLTGLLTAGANTLEIEVTNLSTNRIRDLDRRKVEWKKFHDINLVDHNYKKFDASEWPDEPSGLLGPVTLIPLTSVCKDEGH